MKTFFLRINYFDSPLKNPRQIDEDVGLLEVKLVELEKVWQKREDDLQNQLEIRACDLDENVIEVRAACYYLN